MKYSLGSLVNFKGIEYEVVGEYYPQREFNSSSRAKHLIMRPYNQLKGYLGWRHHIVADHTIFYDPTIFTPIPPLNYMIRSNINLMSCPSGSKYLQPVGTQYDPKQQPWDDGDI